MSLRAHGIFLFLVFTAVTLSAQTITSISPVSGGVGTEITITGTSLYSRYDTNQLYIGGVETPAVWAVTQVIATVPSGIPGNITSVPIQVVQSDGWEDYASNTYMWTILQAPVTSMTPNIGYPGTAVTIRGSGFGTSQGGSSVTLHDVAAPVTYWSDTEIHITVPSGVGSGSFLVNVQGLSPTSTPFFKVWPFIESITPASGGVGTEMYLHGQGLDIPNTEHSLYINGWPTEASYWSNDLVIVTVHAGAVPPDAIGVPVQINYYYDDGYEFSFVASSNTVDFPVSQAPIASVMPASGIPTQAVVINGVRFGSAQNQSIVTFNGVSAEVINWSDTQITAIVPEGAATGYLRVDVPDIGAGTYWFKVRPYLKASVPSLAVPGTLITMLGQGLLPSYETSKLHLNGTEVATESWTDSQIAFFVPNSTAGSSSVSVQAVYETCDDYEGTCVYESSNTLTVPVQIPVSLILTSIAPSSGYVGDIVTIGGAGFGAVQGASMVTFNGANAAPISWNDSQIQVPVPIGAANGPITITSASSTVQSTTFTVLSSPSVAGMSPTSGPVGTEIVISGENFGGPTPECAVLLGGVSLTILDWSDGSIRVSVPGTAESGTVSVRVGPFIMDAGSFTVTGKTIEPDITLSPNQVSLVVDDTRTLDAFDPDGNIISGLTWSSSDTNVVTLSTDDPPLLTAAGVGEATISAGDATATITVYPGPVLPEGTVKWTVTNDGTLPAKILPAVPSPDGIADVFAVAQSGKIQAITSDGHLAWSTQAPSYATLLPDFQGGLVIFDRYASVRRLDGKTGNTTFDYTFSPYSRFEDRLTAVHTDGTIFIVDGDKIKGFDPVNAAATPKSEISLPHSTYTRIADCHTGRQAGNFETNPHLYPTLIAGDQYAYIPFMYTNVVEAGSSTCGSGGSTNIDTHVEQHFRILRVGSSGDHSTITVDDSTQDNHLSGIWPGPLPSHTETTQTNAIADVYASTVSIIGDREGGVLFSWQTEQQAYCASTLYNWDPYISQSIGCVPKVVQNHLTVITGEGVQSDVLQSYPGQIGAFKVIVQNAAGINYGTVDTGGTTPALIAFDNTADVKLTKIAASEPEPLYALADGGTIYRDSGSAQLVTIDANGNEVNRVADDGIKYSWKGAYQRGSTKSLVAELPSLAQSFGAITKGNLTGNGSALKVHHFGLFWCGTGLGKQGECPGSSDVDFSYAPIPSNTISNKTSFSSNVAWVGLVEGAALRAFQRAFEKLPIIVSLATKSRKPWSLETSWDQEYVAQVVGDWPPPAAGYYDGQDSHETGLSRIWYWANLDSAEVALGSPQSPPNGTGCETLSTGWNPYAPDTPENTVKFRRLLEALGTGIGNAAAHESGHYLEKQHVNGGLGLPLMHCGAGNSGRERISCENDNNFVYEFFNDSGFPQCPGQSTGLGAQFRYIDEAIPGASRIHWGPSNEAWIKNWALK